jgi:hypothetical protein
MLLALAARGGTEPRARAEDYPASGRLPGLSIGAEYLVRTVPAAKGSHLAGNYLVVEVAYFPEKQAEVQSGHFRLVVNGAKRGLYPQTPGMVAAGLKYDDWENRRGIQVGAGAGNTGIVIGGPRRDPRFPDDPTARRLPAPPRAPDETGRPERGEPGMTAAEAVTAAALEEGMASAPRSGAVYFAFKDSARKIRTLDLVYEGPAGKLVLKLQ